MPIVERRADFDLLESSCPSGLEVTIQYNGKSRMSMARMLFGGDSHLVEPGRPAMVG